MKPRNTQKREKGIEISTQTGKEAKRQRIEPRRRSAAKPQPNE
jgi:hypothetical protein